MVWGFSHAHIKGLEDPQRSYLEAARLGYEFIRDHFYDTANGGYFTSTDLTGNPLERRKSLYAQSFVIFAFLEYHRASADPRARSEAMDLFRLLQKKAHDGRNNGWFEHFEENWTVITEPYAGQYVIEVPGLKSANAHLHWMEALTALYKEMPDARVKQALAESIEVNQRYFYPKEPGKSSFHRHFDWRPVSAFSSQGLSYGHNVEFAWLMVEAQKALGRAPSWDHFYAHIDHALKFGFDHERGGVHDRGYGDRPASRTDKIWWVQAEMMAALTDAIRNHVRPDYGQALEKLNHFVWSFMVDPRDGIWLDTVAADGAIVSKAKANNWKAAYHDVRAMVKFYETFELSENLLLNWPLEARPGTTP
jgi:mannobiose 2-epimerase